MSNLYNSTQIFEPQVQRINQRSINGKTIYLKTSYEGIKTYVTKSRQMVITPSKGLKTSTVSYLPTYTPLDPYEHEQLYREYPERFSAHRMALLREQIINNGQTWNEREAVTM